MKRSVLLLLTVLFHFTGSHAQDFSEKEKAVIYTNAVKVLEDYQGIINQIGGYVVTDIGKAKSSSEGLLELFVNRQVLIYNDLDPAHKLSEFYEAETYASNIILWYPDGMTVNLNLKDARVGEIMKHEENVYSLDLLVRKSISGNYLNQTPNKNVEELTFRVAFGTENNSPGNFRIAGIRSTTSNYVVDYTQVLKQVNIEDFTPEDIGKIRSGIRSLLNDYVNYLSLIGDKEESSEDKEFYKTSFLKLFQSPETRLYNDIMPEPQVSLISAPEYLNNYIADFPGGINNISLNVDSAKFGNTMKEGDGSLFTYVTVNKFFSGSFKGKEPYRNMSPLIFKISFKAAGKTFTDFLVSSIDFSSVNFYEAAPGTQQPAIPEAKIQPVTRKGFAISFTGAFGQTMINDQNIKELSTETNAHKWDISPLYGYLGAIGISYFFNDHIAIRTGVEYNKYASTFTLNGSFTDNEVSSDLNGYSYYRKIDADYDSTVTADYITAPLLLSFMSGKPGKFGFYAEGGAKFYFPVKSLYSVSGDYKFTGYYPSEPYTGYGEYIDFAELGFYDRPNINEEGDTGIKSICTSLYVSAGINIPLGYYTSILLGPEVTIGLSDALPDNGNYIDIFRKSYDHKPTKIQNFGIRISFVYKL